jgi:hypothetical protein
MRRARAIVPGVLSLCVAAATQVRAGETSRVSVNSAGVEGNSTSTLGFTFELRRAWASWT